jgi:hypothetical protein
MYHHRFTTTSCSLLLICCLQHPPSWNKTNLAITTKQILHLSSIVTFLGGSFVAAVGQGDRNKCHPVKGEMLRGASYMSNDYHGTIFAHHHHDQHLVVVLQSMTAGVSSSFSTSSSSTSCYQAEILGGEEPPMTDHLLGPFAKHDSPHVAPSITMSVTHHDVDNNCHSDSGTPDIIIETATMDSYQEWRYDSACS